MFHIVLVEPEIPHNAGAAGRLALATDSTLHLVGPLGFSLDDKHVKRTGLDYWKDVRLRVWSGLDVLRDAADDSARFWYLSTKSSTNVWEIRFRPGDYLVFGRESRGLPEELVLSEPDRALKIPMAPGGTRSLNLSTAVAVVVFEAVRQQAPGW